MWHTAKRKATVSFPHLPVGAVSRLDKWQVSPHFESPFRRDDVCARVLLQHHLNTTARCAVHMRSRSQAPHRAAPPEHCGTTLDRDPHECTQRQLAARGCDGSAMRHIATAQCVLRAGTARSPSCVAQLGYKAPSARIRLHPTRNHGLASMSEGERTETLNTTANLSDGLCWRAVAKQCGASVCRARTAKQSRALCLRSRSQVLHRPHRLAPTSGTPPTDASQRKGCAR